MECCDLVGVPTGVTILFLNDTGVEQFDRDDTERIPAIITGGDEAGLPLKLFPVFTPNAERRRTNPFLIRHGSFLTRNSSSVSQPPPIRTIT